MALQPTPESGSDFGIPSTSAAAERPSANTAAAMQENDSPAAPQVLSPLAPDSPQKRAAMSEDRREKINRIESACRDLDLLALVRLASSDGGLVEDELRRTACMPS